MISSHLFLHEEQKVTEPVRLGFHASDLTKVWWCFRNILELWQTNLKKKILSTSTIQHINQYNAVSALSAWEKLNEYRVIVCKLGNRAPTGQDMTENRDWDQGIWV